MVKLKPDIRKLPEVEVIVELIVVFAARDVAGFAPVASVRFGILPPPLTVCPEALPVSLTTPEPTAEVAVVETLPPTASVPELRVMP